MSMLLAIVSYSTAGKMGISFSFTQLISAIANEPATARSSGFIYYFNDVFGIEPWFGFTSISPEGGNSETLFGVGSFMNVNVLRERRANFMIKGGFGFLSFGDLSWFTFNVGAGIEFFVNDNFSLYLGARGLFFEKTAIPTDFGPINVNMFGLSSESVDFSMNVYLR